MSARRRFNIWRRIAGLIRAARFRAIVWAIRKYHPEGLSYDPERRIYIFRWAKELDDQLFGGEKV